MKMQIKFLEIIKTLKVNKKISVITILHDLNLAAKFSDKIALLNKGSVVKTGTPKEVLNPDILSEVYDIDIKVQEDPLFITYY